MRTTRVALALVGTALLAASPALVQTGNASVGGVEETVLVDAAGRTPYYRTTDTATTVCSGSCAAIWPRLLARGTGAVSGFGGKLGVLADADGHQVAYDGHPLYTYSGDSAAGQAHGEGILHIWYVATPSLAAGSGASTSTTSSGYGY